MKAEEIEKLAELAYPISLNPNQIIEGFERVAFKKGYTQCRDTMQKDIDELLDELHYIRGMGFEFNTSQKLIQKHTKI